MLFLHNLDDEPQKVHLGQLVDQAEAVDEVFADQTYPPPGDLAALELGTYGYRWIRLTRVS